MKKLFTLLAIALIGVATWSCSYDDKELWSAVNSLDGRVEAMEKAAKQANSDLESLRKVVEALQKSVTISSVDKGADGYTIHFSDGTTATISNGKDGANAPSSLGRKG